MKALTVIGVLILSGAVWAQSALGKHTNSSGPALKTFTSPDGAFRFVYPELLIRCEQRLRSTGEGHYWVAEACNGYGGVCDDAAQTDYITTVCLAYPRNKYTHTPAFEAAAFSVGMVGQIANETDCVAGSANWNVEEKGKAATIGGVTFHAFRTSCGGMSQGFDQVIYRTFHGGKCYQLAIATAMANAQVFDPPAREMTKLDWRQVNRSLEQARDSFVFLK